MIHSPVDRIESTDGCSRWTLSPSVVGQPEVVQQLICTVRVSDLQQPVAADDTLIHILLSKPPEKVKLKFILVDIFLR